MSFRVIALAGLVLLAGCTSGGGSAGASPSTTLSPEPSPLARPSGQLDAEVSMPPGFPSDVPIYTKARLTASASFVSSGQVSWGMEWETLDSVAKVKTFYSVKLNQGDWTISVTGSGSNTFAATFSRKSNSHVLGT
ncbi:MAG: hypothetical protein E6H83_06110, partial [Chloroflexi bacterium]